MIALTDAAVVFFPGPTWADLPPLKSPHTEAEKKAHLVRILELHAAIVQDAMYERLLSSITPLQPVTDCAEYQLGIERSAWRHQHRRDQIDARCRAKLKEERRNAPPHKLVPPIRILPVDGRRIARDSLLTEDDFYVDGARPPFVAHPRLQHICDLCQGMKSHPVM
ncbi:hypothetical protein C8R47DRAFT_1225562 [Mycena vitilis]|nr:hypothetical protein C8R47DRAFT_1225562 [Mycena vitilis]